MTIKELIDNQKIGWSLHQRFYTDPDIYEAELDHIITKNWIMIGHVSEFSNIGDFKVFNMANESAIIVRGPDGNLKAFANVCRHRGSLVCLEQSGTIRKFSCPYHGWVYDYDGTVMETPGEPAGSPICQKVKQGAYPVREFKGLVFAYMGPMSEIPDFPIAVAAVTRLPPFILLRNFHLGSSRNSSAGHVKSIVSKIEGLFFNVIIALTSIFLLEPLIDFYQRL